MAKNKYNNSLVENLDNLSSFKQTFNAPMQRFKCLLHL